MRRFLIFYWAVLNSQSNIKCSLFHNIFFLQINLYCQHYNQLRKYCDSSANVINGNQSIQWVADCINVIVMGPTENTRRYPEDYDTIEQSSETDDVCDCNF